jgi:hypothetical protein
VRGPAFDRELEEAGSLARGLRAAARRGRLQHEHALGASRLALDQLAPAEAARLLVTRQKQHDGTARREAERAARRYGFERDGASGLHVVDARRVDAPFGLSPGHRGQRPARVYGVGVAEQEQRARVRVAVAEGAYDEVLAVASGRVCALNRVRDFKILRRLHEQADGRGAPLAVARGRLYLAQRARQGENAAAPLLEMSEQARGIVVVRL